VLALLFVNDILVLSELASDRERVQQILERQYEKVTVSEGTCLPYLGIMIVKTNNGYEICMKVYIEETIKLYGKVLKEYVTPATQNLFSVNPDSKKCVDSVKFHSVVAKLLFLGKRGRPDILMAVQFLCTRVKESSLEDEKKLLGYLMQRQSACLVMLGNTLVHESCRKQQLDTKNSTEAEIVVLADSILEGEMIEEFIIDYRL